MKFALLLALSLTLTSCFKTAEEIKREKQREIQIQQSSQMIAELTLQVKDLQTKLANATGQIEEIDHNTKTKTEETAMTFTQTIASLSEQVKVLTAENQQNKAKLEALEKEFNSQKKYIKSVNSTLGKIAGPTKKSSSNKLKAAHKAFEKNQQKKAIALYQEVIASGKINARQRNHAQYNLGLLHYWKKDYDNALVYFSKIYTKYPKSSWAPKCLLYIGRSFAKQKKSAEANATFQELIEKYPKSSSAKKAKKEIK